MTGTRTRRTRPRLLVTTVLAVGLSITLAACGARLTEAQRNSAIAYGAPVDNSAANGTSGGSASGGDATGGTSGGSATGGGAAGGTAGGASGGSATGGTTGGGTTGGSAGKTTTGGGGTTGGKTTTGGGSGGGSTTGGTTGGKTTGGGTGGSGGTTGGGTTGGGGTSGGGGGTGGSGGGGSAGPGSDTCTGTASGSTAPGVTATQISIGNASDLSGPIGGLFSSARDATNAYVAYYNATHPQGVCGRKLKLDAYDSQTNDSGDNQQTIAACQADFALVGSVSAFDSGGAAQASQCGIPDLRAVSTTRARQQCGTCYGVDSQQLPEVPQVQPDFWNKQFPGAGTKAAFLYVNTGTTAQQAKSWEAAYAKDGFTWVLDQPIGISESDYTPYVAKMQQAGVQYVQFLGAFQEATTLMQNMQAQGFKPKVTVLDPTGYDPNFVKSAGAAANGVYVFSNGAMFEEASSNPELALYVKWLGQVAPGQPPTYFGMYAWSAAELFVRLANQIGPNLTRQAMVSAIQGVHGYTGNGMFAAEDVGGKHTSPCALFMQLQGTTWKRVSPGSGWTCGGLINSGVG